MPRTEILSNFHIHAAKGTEIDESGDEPTMNDIWTVILTDRNTQDQIRISFRREARDELVRQLTGGVVLAGGQFPRSH